MQIYAKRFYSFTINPIVFTCQGKISALEGNGGIKNCLGNECFLVLGLDSGCRLRKANVQDRINFNLPARSIVFICLELLNFLHDEIDMSAWICWYTLFVYFSFSCLFHGMRKPGFILFWFQ